MIRTIVRAALPVLALAALTPANAVAASGGYAATLATALPAARSEVLNGVLWKCAADRCAAPAQESRALIVCQKVVKKFGAIARFATPAGELGAEDLARCNAR